MSSNPIPTSAPPSPVTPVIPSQDNSQDATAQALFIIGLLGLYASRYAALEAEYEKNPDPSIKAEMDSILSQFNEFRAYFTVNGSSVTFSYNEGAETIQLNDPTLLALVQGMPTDIDKFNSFWNTATNPPLISIIQWMNDNNFDFGSASQTTQGMALIFMLSIQSNTVGSLGGIVSEWLSSNHLFSNDFIAAEALSAFLGNDKVINAADLIDALNIPNAGVAYNQFYSILSSNYQDWMKIFSPDESDFLLYEGRYWLDSIGVQSNGPAVIHAAPLAKNQNTIQNNKGK